MRIDKAKEYLKSVLPNHEYYNYIDKHLAGDFAVAIAEKIAAKRLLPIQFNMLTPAESERLYLLSEELGESVQAICKILHHGYESTHPDGGLSNRLSLAMELGHVEAALELLFESGDLSLPSVENSKKAKLVNVKKYLHHQ